ncbi:Rz1-like lysis system protein LysC [Vibrio cholerae]|uniref:Rz1-like lysis system protein LysC n=1 Tax=Vibrio cholerae TaxID=666 RepID=UPI001C927CF9|nr:Rz1-like lysis system protein LysC [Vibrio cholerae]MCU4216038.1 Rz1-like lysis system protein LysC [Vibrio cholerae]MDV2325499.1 Rz1-like lysis system protein LysC [Vibrio cholerae]MDV2372209.1 Rz1-like lysis system protein LysC [Vibrio cholerae]
MKPVLICLSLILVSGCTTSQVVTEYRERLVIPPAVYLTTCEQPFSQPPRTYGEAVKRDPVWFAAWRSCADQIEQLRRFYQFDAVQPNTDEKTLP